MLFCRGRYYRMWLIEKRLRCYLWKKTPQTSKFPSTSWKRMPVKRGGDETCKWGTGSGASGADRHGAPGLHVSRQFLNTLHWLCTGLYLRAWGSLCFPTPNQNSYIALPWCGRTNDFSPQQAKAPTSEPENRPCCNTKASSSLWRPSRDLLTENPCF